MNIFKRYHFMFILLGTIVFGYFIASVIAFKTFPKPEINVINTPKIITQTPRPENKITREPTKASLPTVKAVKKPPPNH